MCGVTRLLCACISLMRIHPNTICQAHVCCSVLQCVAVCCSVIQCVEVYLSHVTHMYESRHTYEWVMSQVLGDVVQGEEASDSSIGGPAIQYDPRTGMYV